MTGESTKDKLVRLETIVSTLQPNLESLSKNTKINSIKMASATNLHRVRVF